MQRTGTARRITKRTKESTDLGYIRLQNLVSYAGYLKIAYPFYSKFVFTPDMFQ